MNNISSSEAERVSLVPVKTAAGCTVWRATEPDAPGLYAIIANEDGTALPAAPENDDLAIWIISEDMRKSLGAVVLTGRSGLNKWYLENVGHEPDREPDGPLPIMRLIDNVAAHLLLQYFEERLRPSGE